LNVRNNLYRVIFPVIALVAFDVSARAQSSSTINLSGRPRDAVISRDATTTFIALQDSREVIKVSLPGGESLGTVRLDSEPTAVALSADETILAVLSTAGKSLTLVQVSDMKPISFVQVGDGARDVTAVPGGGFAVVNALSDSITLVPSGGSDHPATIEGVSSVPNGIAASGSYLAVTTRVPSAILLFADGDKRSGKIALPDTPSAVSSVSNDTFVVVTKSGLVLADATAKRIVHEVAIANVTGIGTSGETIVAITPTEAIILSNSLTETSRLLLAPETTAIAASGGTLVSLASASKQANVFASLAIDVPAPLPSTAPAPVIAPPPPTQTVSEPAPDVRPAQPTTPSKEEVEAETVQEKTESPEAPSPATEPAAPPPAPVAEEKPAEAAPLPSPEPTPEKVSAPETPIEPKPVADQKHDETPTQIAAAAAPTQKTTGPKPGPVRKVPLGSFETGAPSPRANRPSPFPSLGPSQPSLTEGITSELQKPTSPGFEPPDWKQPWKNLRASGKSVFDPSTNTVEAFDNVSFTLENLNVKTDYIYYNSASGDLRAEGNVQLTQNGSSLTADKLYYTVPLTLSVEEQPSPLIGATEQDLEKERLSKGTVDATNVHLVEPDRDITADHLVYDAAAKTGEAENVKGHYNIFYFGAKKVRILGPASAGGEEMWVTTCDHDPPHYKVRLKKAQIGSAEGVKGSSAQMEIGTAKTPLYWPQFRLGAAAGAAANFDFDSGKRAVIGYYVNLGETFAVTKEVDLGVRLYPTTHEGVGVGFEGAYDYMNAPASPLFRSKGEFRSLGTTQERGYYEWYHRHEFTPDLVLLAQTEQWSDEDFYKDFYYEQFRNRSEPRTFADLTYTQPGYIASASMSKRTNAGIATSERLPEFSYHLLEREIAENLYVTFDTVNGYAVRQPSKTDAVRTINVARLTYDWDVTEALTVNPFYEAELSWYSEEPRDDESNARFSNTVGATIQTRFHKVYPGAFGFAGFKHVVVPSLTYSYRPEPTMDFEETPRFDEYDNVYGRSRIESKIDNVIFGKDAETQEVWQVARFTFYQGTDLWNEFRKSDDYEIELDVRPRPWYGFQTAAEHHAISNDASIDEPFFFERTIIQAYEQLFNRKVDTETALKYNAQYGDYNRVLSYVYYNDQPQGGKFNGRIGFAFTETQDDVFNRELLYGAGYQIGEKWGVGFEHRYDFERDELVRQEYEVRRNLHCWEAAVRFKEREEGWDLNFQLSLVAFPGAKVKF
jgi:lipopolysaccharide assembly outer membrane protein LptD (OstA)